MPGVPAPLGADTAAVRREVKAQVFSGGGPAATAEQQGGRKQCKAQHTQMCKHGACWNVNDAAARGVHQCTWGCEGNIQQRRTRSCLEGARASPDEATRFMRACMGRGADPPAPCSADSCGQLPSPAFSSDGLALLLNPPGGVVPSSAAALAAAEAGAMACSWRVLLLLAPDAEACCCCCCPAWLLLGWVASPAAAGRGATCAVRSRLRCNISSAAPGNWPREGLPLSQPPPCPGLAAATPLLLGCPQEAAAAEARCPTCCCCCGVAGWPAAEEPPCCMLDTSSADK